MSSNNNIIFERTSREEENWREIPIKVIFKKSL